MPAFVEIFQKKYKFPTLYDSYYYVLLARNRISLLTFGLPKSLEEPRTEVNSFHALVAVLYVILNIFQNYTAYHNIDKIFQSKSLLVNLGLAMVLVVGYSIQIVTTPITHIYREKLWKVLRSAEQADKIVSKYVSRLLKTAHRYYLIKCIIIVPRTWSLF